MTNQNNLVCISGNVGAYWHVALNLDYFGMLKIVGNKKISIRFFCIILLQKVLFQQICMLLDSKVGQILFKHFIKQITTSFFALDIFFGQWIILNKRRSVLKVDSFGDIIQIYSNILILFFCIVLQQKFSFQQICMLLDSIVGQILFKHFFKQVTTSFFLRWTFFLVIELFWTKKVRLEMLILLEI